MNINCLLYNLLQYKYTNNYLTECNIRKKKLQSLSCDYITHKIFSNFSIDLYLITSGRITFCQILVSRVRNTAATLTVNSYIRIQ